MPRTAKIRVEVEKEVEVVRRFFVGHGATGFGSSETGHSHVAVDGLIDCEECAIAHDLPAVDVEAPAAQATAVPEAVQAAQEQTPAVSEVPAGPAASPVIEVPPAAPPAVPA
jgi:hypothetical protein